MSSAFRGAIQRAMQAAQGRAPKPRDIKGAIAQVVSRARQQPQPAQPTKGHGFRNAGPIKPSITAEADATLAQTGEGLRKTIGKVAGGRYKEGGKVGSAMTALQRLAKKYREALDMEDTDTAGRIARQMERLEPGSSKSIRDKIGERSERASADKAATFAEGGIMRKAKGGKVKNIKKVLGKLHTVYFERDGGPDRGGTEGSAVVRALDGHAAASIIKQREKNVTKVYKGETKVTKFDASPEELKNPRYSKLKDDEYEIYDEGT